MGKWSDRLSAIQEAKSIPKNLDAVVAAVAKATDENQHNEALIIWAKFLKAEKWVKILQAAEALLMAWGSLPPGGDQIRSDASKELADFTERMYGPEAVQKFWNAL